MDGKVKIIASLLVLVVVGLVLLLLYTDKLDSEHFNFTVPKEGEKRDQFKEAISESDYVKYNKVFIAAHNSVVMYQYRTPFDLVTFEKQIQTLREIKERIVSNAVRENLSSYEVELGIRGIDKMIKVLELYLALLRTEDPALLQSWEDAFNDYLDYADDLTDRPDLLEQNAVLRDWPAVFKQRFIQAYEKDIMER